MQKKFFRFSLILILALFFGSILRISPSNAQTMFLGYTSAGQVYNASASSIAVTIKLYNPDGTTASTLNDTISGNSSKTYFPLNNFAGSMSVTSTGGNLVAIGNLVAVGQIAGASYVGNNSGATALYIPLLQKNNGGYFSWFAVKNLGASTANVSVQYTDISGNPTTFTIPANGTATLYQLFEDAHTQATFGATVTSNQPIIATVIQENTRTMFAYSASANTGATLPVFPLINANNNGTITGIQLKNNGAQATNVTVSYQPSTSGTACTETQTIASAGTNTFALLVFDSNSSNNPTTTCPASGQTLVGSARVTANSANMPLTGVVNQLNSSTKKGGAYTSFDPGTTTNKVAFPLVMDRNGAQQYYTAFSIQNIGTTATTVSCTFSSNSNSFSQALSAGQSFILSQANLFGTNWVGSAKCTATNTTDKIVGVLNQLGNSTFLDQLLVNEGLNVQ